MYAGHDYPLDGRKAAQFTTVGQERTLNKHLLGITERETFVDWRNTRDAQLGTPKLLYPSLLFNIKAGRPPSSGFVKIPIKAPFKI